MPDVYIALGANLGDRRENLRSALRMLPQEVLVVTVSSLYETEAVTPDGADQPLYYNAAARLETSMEAREFLDALKAIEQSLGRDPASPPWSPRPIDLDILLYGDDVIDEPGLTVPHPRLPERPFVLIPLFEIAPDVVHPLTGRTIAQHANDAGSQGVTQIEPPTWADSQDPPP